MAMITAVTVRPTAPVATIARAQAFRPVRAPLTGLSARHRVIVKAEEVGACIKLTNATRVMLLEFWDDILSNP